MSVSFSMLSSPTLQRRATTERVAWIVLLFLMAASCGSPTCDATIEHRSTEIVDERLVSRFAVDHPASSAAWVYFEYRIHYRSCRGEALEERGAFRDRFAPGPRLIERRDIPWASVCAVSKVEITTVHCRPADVAGEVERHLDERDSAPGVSSSRAGSGCPGGASGPAPRKNGKSVRHEE